MTSARNEQIRELYKAALERPASERVAFVAERSAGDVGLRESVELLLSQQDATGVGSAPSPAPAAHPDLPSGTAVGSYRIDDVLGRGGMGVVYRATDTKLRRPVAIKFLSTALADSQARRRFQQEAETASSLNHPHIVTVHDVGEHDGQQYIVSELVDGGTLNDWLTAPRERPWRQSVELLTGVADAIAAAHAAGILHRDVKPGNILIGRNGYAKLADFGLAKLVENGAQSPAHPPPRSAAPTGIGVVIGTVAYMSPEQAAGHPLDARSDVFSFGVVLYETLAGRSPFEAANDLELLKKIAHGVPPPLPATVPEAVRAIVEKALEKDPAERYQHVQDLVVDLRRAARKSGVTQPTAGVGPPAAKSRRQFGWPVVAGLALAFAAALVPAARFFLSEPPPPQEVRFAIPAPGFTGGLTISPNGRYIAYVAASSGERRLWLRSIAALDARPIPGTDGADSPFWSPDSRNLAFFAAGQLKKVALDGAPPETLADAMVALPGSWSRDGTILFAATTDTGFPAIHKTSAAGGAAVPVTELDSSRGEVFHLLPVFLPDGRSFLFLSFTSITNVTSAPATPTATLAMGALDGTPTTSLLATGAAGNTRPAFAGRYLLYTRDSALMAQRFDPDTRALSGPAVAVAENVAEFAVSEDGTLVYVAALPSPAARGGGRELVWFDREGRRTGSVAAPADVTNPALSPDGERLAFNGLPTASDSEIWTIDLARGARARLTFEPANTVPLWSPDGTRLLFNSTRGSGTVIPNRLYQRAANGTGSDELLYTGAPDEVAVPSSWSKDRRYVLFARMSVATLASVSDIWVLPMDGDRAAYPLIQSSTLKTGPRLSPDGRWVAYATDESGTRQIVVQPFPAVSEGKWQVSTNGGFEPSWRADGGELFFLGLDGAMMAVEVGAADGFEHGPATKLFDTGLTFRSFVTETFYDVTADGQRFLVNTYVAEPGAQDAAEPAPVPITVVVNAIAGLDSR